MEVYCGYKSSKRTNNGGGIRMAKTYYVYMTKASSRHKVAKELYLKYMELAGIESDIPITFEHELLYGLVEDNNPYYMRDNHTFKELTGSVENMLLQIKEEFDAGYTHGMVCAHGFSGVVHFSGEFKALEASLWLKEYTNENNNDL